MSLDLSRSLGFSRHADLKTRKDGPVLVLPERAIRIGGSGAEILALVAEGRTVESVLSAMRERYPDSADTPDLAAEVLGFLEEMLGLGALVDVVDLEERRERSS
jgi:hypothetical protein